MFRQNQCSALLSIFLAFCHVRRLRGYHPLWLPFPGGFNAFHIISYFMVFCLFKKRAKHHKMGEEYFLLKKRAKGKKRPYPLSLTTTYGISVDFFSFSYVDVSIH